MTRQTWKLVGVALLSATIGGAAAFAAQPRMVTAKADLEKALSELQAAATDKAGHRVKAIRLVKEAIGEVDAGIAAGM